MLYVPLLFTELDLLGGLFQPTFLSQTHEILLSFIPVIVKYNSNNFDDLSNPINDSDGSSNCEDITFKTWLISNTPAKVYLNSKESKSLIYKENNKCSGIYLWFNNINEKYYIGSAKDLRNRLARYYSDKELARTNNLIHKAIIKHKHHNFSLYILEYCDLDNLIAREQFYLDSLTPPYNILTVAGSSLGFKHSEETKALMSEIKIKDLDLLERIEALSEINRGSVKSEEFKALRSTLTKGENNPMFGKAHTPESRALMGLKKKRCPS
jgi:group I intron endonuclease